MDMTSASIYGTAPTFIGTTPAQTAMTATDSLPGGGLVKSLCNPKNPLFWFAAVMAITVGAAGVAGSVRLGNSKVAANVGKA